MPWNRNDPPDPLEARRKELEEQQRLLAEQRKRLTRELHESIDPSSEDKPAIHPVWRMEEEGRSTRPTDPTPSRKKHLAHQRRRDMWFVIVLVAFLFVVLMIVLWVAKFHNSAPVGGA